MGRVALETLTKEEQYKHDCRIAKDFIHSKRYSFHFHPHVLDIITEFNRVLVQEYPRTTCMISSVVMHARADGLYEMGFVFTERLIVDDSAFAEQMRIIADACSLYPESVPDFYERALLFQRQQGINHELAEMQVRLLESRYVQQQENI